MRVAAFDGENADPLNGRRLDGDLFAKTPWGEIAYQLAGRPGFERVRQSDEYGSPPGADTLRELFGNEPTLILLDELSIYLRKLKAKDRQQAGEQLTAFLTGLFKAVESSPQAALVFTLAIGKQDRRATDAYSDENQFIAAQMEEMASVAARKATLLDPTEEDETVKVLCRRLFDFINTSQAERIIQAYQDLWNQQREAIATPASPDVRLAAFRNGYPLHPELIETLRDKTATLSNFQRVRGMLRLLARTVAQLWQAQPRDTYAIHLHHLDPANETIRREIVTKLGLKQYLPAIRADVAGVADDAPALAQQLDTQDYRGLATYGSYVGRAILFHSLAFNESLRGLTEQQLRYSLLAPGLDLSFINQAAQAFVQRSAYLDDRAQAPLRFLTEANLTQMIWRREQLIDPAEIRQQLNDRIRSIFQGTTFDPILFPAGPHDIPDDTNNGKPYLAILGYEAAWVDSVQLQVPELVEKLFLEKGSSGDTRLNRNNLVFLCADCDRREDMRRRMQRRLALRELRRPEVQNDLAEHQRAKIAELEKNAETQVALAIQQAYRHLFYPSKARAPGAAIDLAHASLEIPQSSEAPGAGQKSLVSKLQASQSKLKLPDDQPDSPTFVRDRTPLRSGSISTAALRQEFYRDPNLPILIGHENLVKLIRQGIEESVWIYRSGDLFWGPGLPAVTLEFSENAYIYTLEYATDQDLWPPRSPEPTQPPSPEEYGRGGGTAPRAANGDGPTTRGSSDHSTTAVEPEPLPPSQPEFTAEGPLREALARVWEQARAASVARLATLEIQIAAVNDAITLVGTASLVKAGSAAISVKLEGEYSTTAGSTLGFEFQGAIADAQALKQFLSAQMRAAAEKSLVADFRLEFCEGLDLNGDDPETLTEQLSKKGIGAAHVSARAAGVES